ncbi:farnesyl-diphosphate synthase [Candidatus Methylacidiphilum fumarolicum]|uniref:Geranylgeranyl pyrophosphate synthase n=3 Tax=Candidatus Methylacidiphilum fumarolicum TaxID=591154 RepID=I0JXS7_METFB|nr:farnesyl diphosphate synthase [Candidatus Methylacidiphilum fumarolicum]TFE69187.1 farnesyl-diphosphate synthase [Candidatus Methylacidiphilum fumarolicum]TFE77756.1 farnesyl-diphosphate synthase [Candidatus Methylacidiphilum fumarolicum]CAI9086371.1 Farnesyl diphosphate synthase [Candidatus Methylacidiphilum fumarolicum]CCG92046.1 Geranylgeranyl pyrophosphate synthase [Methylacidiphilum fumariolicum SolV]
MDDKAMEIEAYIAKQQGIIESALRKYVTDKSKKPRILHEAIDYSLFSGGKRLRPILCLAGAHTVCMATDCALPMACAVECIHTYSLIHDDLPSMDNDDFRRGKPSLHKIYGEAMAILTGDALLALAFEIASLCSPLGSSYPLSTMIWELARAAGSRALVAGQVADLESEGKEIGLTQLRYIHCRKTAALITVALRLGAMSANADEKTLRLITKYGRSLGLAFQIIDDILDVTQTTEILGKSAGKDQKAKKATYPRIMGLEYSKKAAAYYTQKSLYYASALGENGKLLSELANYLLARKR